MRDDLFDPRLTEQRNPRTLDIDLASELEIVDSINAEDRLVPEAVLGEREQIAAATKITVDCLQRGGRLIYVGAGTSGRLGILDYASRGYRRWRHGRAFGAPYRGCRTRSMDE